MFGYIGTKRLETGGIDRQAVKLGKRTRLLVFPFAEDGSKNSVCVDWPKSMIKIARGAATKLSKKLWINLDAQQPSRIFQANHEAR